MNHSIAFLEEFFSLFCFIIQSFIHCEDYFSKLLTARTNRCDFVIVRTADKWRYNIHVWYAPLKNGTLTFVQGQLQWEVESQNQSKWSTPLWPLYPHHSLLTCFLNSDQTLWSDQKTLEPFTSTVHLRWRTIPCEKSLELSRLQSNRPILWTMTDSHGSGSCLVSSLKRRRSTFFFSPIRRHLEHIEQI